MRRGGAANGVSGNIARPIGLPLKRFENWRAKFKQESEVSRKLLYRRSGGLSHMTKRASHMTNGIGLPVPGATTGATGRRRFSEAEKQRIVDEASQLGASVGMVARRYEIAPRVLFHPDLRACADHRSRPGRSLRLCRRHR
jgi:hypothetical protein